MTPYMLTFDIEEWFQVENLRPVFPPESWEAMPRRSVPSTRLVLDLLAKHSIQATFFVLGWVAEREPDLVREIVGRGHEVACHGYGHVMPMKLTIEQFQEDVCRAREVLELTSGQEVVGYRAPSFSIDRQRLRALNQWGFLYDSSYHPFGLHDRYGSVGDLGRPVVPGVYQLEGEMIEVALPVERMGGLPLPVSGGGYFRLYPGMVFRRLVRRAVARQGHYELYLHSWEFDPKQPRAWAAGATAMFRHYNNLSRTLPRLRQLIGMLADMGGQFITIKDFAREVRKRSIPGII